MARSVAPGMMVNNVTTPLGGTYAGSPIAIAAADAVLDVIEDEDLCARAEETGKRIADRLERMAAGATLAPAIGDIRRLGAMVALELIEDDDAAMPAAALTKDLVQAAAARGLIGAGLRYARQRDPLPRIADRRHRAD